MNGLVREIARALGAAWQALVGRARRRIVEPDRALPGSTHVS